MIGLLWTVVALPLLGFLILAFLGRRLPRPVVAPVGVGSVLASAAAAAVVTWGFFTELPADANGVRQFLWHWFDVAGFQADAAFQLDGLSLVMMHVVTGVGALIHIYSLAFMWEDRSYGRFFASMNLFVASMLVLVLADDLLLLYLGWEGVGLCSFLLIGFWYEDEDNARAARKAFVVTRVGDAAMAVGLFLLFQELGTLRIADVLARADVAWTEGATTPTLAAALLFAGAVGKSAQLPLQTWLPDAMAGPTPVSALIHAATMVTAGVYLVARTHGLFELAPAVMTAVAVVGAATLLMAAFAALAQRDIKRILAYSTISQLGYMFLGLGVGAYSAAIFHLVTHAFFKALLFLGAGVLIHTLHHEHDIFRMGGLRKKLLVTFWTFLAGSAALAGFPFITAGFWSKDLILWRAWTAPAGGELLWAVGLLGAFLTAVYIFRAVFVAFLGTEGPEPDRTPSNALLFPLVVLGVLSLAGGLLDPAPLLADVFPEAAAHGDAPHGAKLVMEIVAGGVSLLGIAAAWLLFRPGSRQRLPVPHALERLWASGWGFDRAYDFLLVRPLAAFARLNRSDVLDLPPRAIAALARGGHRMMRATQTGRLRWYAAGLATGAVLLLTLVLVS
ncbi:MAG: NADH-quinone oxidoreductase subunit L [Myxococcota bacterium]